jgi:hypothetical protein
MIRNTRRNSWNWKLTSVGLLATLLTISLAGCSSQSNNAGNTTVTSASPSPAVAVATASPTVSPATGAAATDASLKEAAMTWGHIEEARAQLDQAVEAENLREVHDATVKVRDSVNALPGKSAALPADKRETLNAQAKEVDRLAGKLGEAAHTNNTDAMHENHRALNAALDQMKGLYPPGREMMDKGMEGMKMGKEMMDKGKDTMDKDTVDKGMKMMDEGMDMMEMGKDMMDKGMVDKDMDMMMDKGMDMMDKGKATMNKGKDAMDKGMMEKGMHMMDNGMQMMGKSMEAMGKKMGDKSMPMKKKDDKKMKGMGHM